MTATDANRDLAGFRTEVHRFCAQWAWRAPELDENSIFARDLMELMGERGWTGPIVPKEYGGPGAGAAEYIIVSEELAYAGLPVPQGNIQIEKILLDHGTEEQKRRWLPGLATGRLIAGIAISEPEAGSSLKYLATTAERRGDQWSIQGQKTHINLAADADLLALFAKTPLGLTVFMLEMAKTPAKCTKLDPIGIRNLPVYEMTLEDILVDDANRVGPEGQAMQVFFHTFNLSRIGNAAHFVGLARASLDGATDYVRKRKVGDSYVKDFQGVRWMFADLAMRLEAARLLVEQAARLEDEGREHVKETAMAKAYAAEVAEDAAAQAIQLVGGHACYRGAPFERILRDVKTLAIAGGASEVLKNLVARAVLDK